MKDSIREFHNLTIIDLIGELKISDLAEYSTIFDDIIKHDNCRIIINMKHLTYIDSTAIGLIVNFKRNVEKHKGIIVVCNVQHDIKSVFDITGITKFIDIYQSEEEAQQALTVQ
jgi:anti-anti-sigma factor